MFMGLQKLNVSFMWFDLQVSDFIHQAKPGVRGGLEEQIGNQKNREKGPENRGAHTRKKRAPKKKNTDSSSEAGEAGV